MPIKLPPLHPVQQQVSNSPARFKVLVAGRRFGKSKLALLTALDHAVNMGHDVWFVSPTYNNVSTHWRDTKRMLEKFPGVTYKNEQQKYIEFRPAKNGKRGSISFKSGDRPDNLRGSGLDYVVIDEAAFTPSALWDEVIRPSLADRQGQALIISTPNGVSNWFYRSYLLGLDASEPEWASWRFPTSSNPFIAPQEIESARRTMPDLKFRQEFLAEFVSDANGVFRSVERVALNKILAGPRRIDPEDTGSGYFHYIAGVDWGRVNDFTTINIFEVETRQQVDLVRFTEVGFNLQLERLRSEKRKWGLSHIYPEANALGMGIVEQLEADQEFADIVTPIFMTNPVKTELVDRLAVAIEREALTLLSPTESIVGEIQLAELQAYQMKRSISGVYTYSAPYGFHDDTVVSLMLVNQGLTMPHRASKLVFAENPFYR